MSSRGGPGVPAGRGFRLRLKYQCWASALKLKASKSYSPPSPLPSGWAGGGSAGPSRGVGGVGGGSQVPRKTSLPLDFERGGTHLQYPVPGACWKNTCMNQGGTPVYACLTPLGRREP